MPAGHAARAERGGDRRQLRALHARLARVRDVVAVAMEQLTRDPLVFLHPADAGCGECDIARASVV